MKAEFEYKDAMSDLIKETSRVSKIPDAEATKCLREIGTAIKNQVIFTAPVSNKTYDEKGDHIANDVVFKVKKSRATGERYVSVSGGKKTWRKWHLVNDGHVAKNGDYVVGNYFADKAAVQCESAIDGIVDRWCGSIVES